MFPEATQTIPVRRVFVEPDGQTARSVNSFFRFSELLAFVKTPVIRFTCSANDAKIAASSGRGVTPVVTSCDEAAGEITRCEWSQGDRTLTFEAIGPIDIAVLKAAFEKHSPGYDPAKVSLFCRVSHSTNNSVIRLKLTI